MPERTGVAIGDQNAADDELFRAWCRALATRIELIAREHERDMSEMEVKIRELRDVIRLLSESVRDKIEP